MRGLFSQDDQLSSRELTEISCGLTILSFTVLILLYTFVVLCCTFYERNLRCGRTLGIHLPTGSPRYTPFLLPDFVFPYHHLLVYLNFDIINESEIVRKASRKHAPLLQTISPVGTGMFEGSFKWSKIFSVLIPADGFWVGRMTQSSCWKWSPLVCRWHYGVCSILLC